MKIKLIEVIEAYLPYFKYLDPFEQINESMPSSFHLLGALASESGTDTPAGLMVLEIKSTTLFIHWLYVAPKYRCQRIGSLLLEAVFEEACERNLKSIRAYVAKSYLDPKLGWDPAGYLRECFFTEIPDTPNDEEKIIFSASTSVYIKEREKFKKAFIQGGKND